MPEEIESPMEHLAEELHHEASHGHETWIKLAAVFSALFAVLAAVAGLESAHYANDAMIEQIEASDNWSYYQAKGIKMMVTESEQHMMEKMGDKNGGYVEKIAKYQGEQDQIKHDADEKVAASKAHIKQHEILSRAVTLFQVAIAMIAIAVLARRREFMLFSGGLGVVGAYYFIAGLLM